jgi:DNA helicase-2/ATP-dependent DNA helicase PcrA
MRSLSRARTHARLIRTRLGLEMAGLLGRVVAYIESKTGHDLELQPVSASALRGSKAEVNSADGCLYYDQALTGFELLFVLLHELGHLELHHRLKQVDTLPDPIISSIYANDGSAAVARYNPRAQEEAEANAFALEFLCPSDEAFRLWHEGNLTSQIAARLGVPVYVVRLQLAEALYQVAYGAPRTAPSQDQPLFECDESQRAAATSTGAPVLVNAGPGTGKTATLVRRIAYLLDVHRAHPEQFLVLTFSNEATDELRQRIASRFGEDIASAITISTFHGFGVSLLHHYGHFDGVDAQACIMDEAGQRELVTSLLAEVPCGTLLNLARPHETVELIVQHLDYLKDRLYTPETLAAALAGWQPSAAEQTRYAQAQEVLGLFRRYEEARSARKLLDFADLIALPIRILTHEEAIRTTYRQRYPWVLVDEYQDVCRSVASLLRLLCGPDNPPWVVGDPRQAIFRFRGAAPENVQAFQEDFPGARPFHLTINYRSCSDVVEEANHLARLMHAAQPGGTGAFEAWQPHPSNPTAFGLPAVRIAVATSDKAEQQGIVQQVCSWRTAGAALSDIVVLARRNIDVRNIVLALGAAEIPATTSGLATAEGVAGDLANLITLADHPRSALPRLAETLGRSRFERTTIDAVIKPALATLDAHGHFASEDYGEGAELAQEMVRAWEALNAEKFAGDAFTQICVFLFEGSDCLRRLLRQPASAERALAFDEIVTSLSKAASYRFTHPKSEAWVSRKGFAALFRQSLSASAYSLLPAKTHVDAVRVMTCHAAKGLEFPCVIAAGQTLSQMTSPYAWLPPALTPDPDEDTRQADALLFVSVTRAKRAVMVSYATSASGTPHARARAPVELLPTWQEARRIPTTQLPSVAPVRQHVEIPTVWGGHTRQALGSHTLRQEHCAIRTYLTDFLGVRFPLNDGPLYPIFYQITRAVLEKIVLQAQERGRPLDPAEGHALFVTDWSAHPSASSHPHHPIYFTLGGQYAERFALAYHPQPRAETFLDLQVSEQQTDFPLRLELVTLYQAAGGDVVSIAFRPESLADKTNATGLRWGDFRTHRTPFVVLKRLYPTLRPSVFSGEDGVLYPFLWPATRYFEEESRTLGHRVAAFARGVFIQQIREWDCDNRCDCRLACPYWMQQ